MATWPTSLPQELNEEGFSTELIDNTIRTQMDYGPAKVRKRCTSNVMKVEGSVSLNSTQLTTFMSFFNSNCAYGATAFDWTHPLTGNNCSMRFVSPPKIRPIGGNITEVQMSLEILT